MYIQLSKNEQVQLLTIKTKSSPKKLIVIILSVLLSNSLFGYGDFYNNKAFYGVGLNFEVIEDVLDNLTIQEDSITVFKNLAISHAREKNEAKSIEFIEKYLRSTGDLSIINAHLFEPISNTQSFKEIQEKYYPKVTLVSIILVCGAVLGFFVFILLNTKRDTDRIGNLLISLFVLFNALFILHVSLFNTNYHYYIPHSLLATTTFSFLYGPLLYFYFKRAVNDHKFKYYDIVHLIPSFVLLAYMLPLYGLTKLEKFNILIVGALELPGANAIIVFKILSLAFYAFLSIKIYREYRNNPKKINKVKSYLKWQRNILFLFSVYTVSYIFYALSITDIIVWDLFYYFQVFVMVSTVVYVAYIAYEKPEIFKGNIKLIDPIDLFKYKKSGLTSSHSLELRDNLLHLLRDDKIYKENNVCLEVLAEKLETTRHNTSQVINEHFKMNFFELINEYRISEAAEILKNDKYNSLSIIQVAYEVGYNNKVSFNKSFKKKFAQTPSQYIKKYRA